MSILIVAAACGRMSIMRGVLLALGKLGDADFINRGGPHGGTLTL